MILAVSKFANGRIAVVVGLDSLNIDMIQRGQPAWVEGDLVDKQAPLARGALLKDVDVIIGCGTEAEVRAQLGQNVKEPPVVDRLGDLKGILQSVLEQVGDVDGHHLENAISELGQAVEGFEEATNNA